MLIARGVQDVLVRVLWFRDGRVADHQRHLAVIGDGVALMGERNIHGAIGQDDVGADCVRLTRVVATATVMVTTVVATPAQG